VSLKAPEQIRTLQRKLFVKAKDEPGFRFYLGYRPPTWRYRTVRSGRPGSASDGSAVPGGQRVRRGPPVAGRSGRDRPVPIFFSRFCDTPESL